MKHGSMEAQKGGEVMSLLLRYGFGKQVQIPQVYYCVLDELATPLSRVRFQTRNVEKYGIIVH